MTTDPYQPPTYQTRARRQGFKTSTLVGMVFMFVLFVGMGLMTLTVGRPQAGTVPRVRQVAAAPPHAETPAEDAPEPNGHIVAKVVGVVDGDTIDVLTAEHETTRLQLNGIDCPERGQPFGNRAEEFVRNFCAGKTVQIETLGVDEYDRTIAEIHCGARHLNWELVRLGLAWHDIQNAPERDDLAQAEQESREAAEGLWAGMRRPVAPWDWRKLSETEPDQLR